MIETRYDRKRGCGYRKPGGLYFVCPGVGRACLKLPIPLECCPTCGTGIKFARGWTWVNGTALAATKDCPGTDCGTCPLAGALGRCGLLWIGEKFYKRPEDWTREANAMGVSRRIQSLPRGFELGKTWVLVAHIKAIENADGSFTPAIFHAFRPSAVEYVVTGQETPDEIEAMEKRGITCIEVKHDDEQEAPEPLFDDEYADFPDDVLDVEAAE